MGDQMALESEFGRLSAFERGLFIMYPENVLETFRRRKKTLEDLNQNKTGNTNWGSRLNSSSEGTEKDNLKDEKDNLKDEKDKLKDEKDKDQENLQESILGNEDEDAKNDQEDGKEKKLRVRTPTAVMASSWLWLEGRPKGYRPPRN